MKIICMIGLWLATCIHAFAADLCPPTKTGAEWSVECFEGKEDARRVKAQYLDRIRFNAHGIATILIGIPRELLAVDRKGNVVVPDIRHAGDFDYPSAYRGIGRFSVIKTDAAGNRTEKCGYFKSPQFRILIPAEFNQCEAFNKNGAYACKDCVSYCSDADCHVREFIGGRGFVLGTDGAVKKEFVVKTLETYCRRPDLVRVTPTGGGTSLIRCDGPSDNPFVM
jgi:hypothetical protein